VEAPDTSTIPALCTTNSFLKEKCKAKYRKGSPKAATKKEKDVIGETENNSQK
jgi:hypothetical protein